MTHHHQRVVHSTPLIASTERMHEMAETCWCKPHVVDCFAERMVIHHDESDPVLDRWWEPIRANLALNEDQATDALTRAGAERGIFRQCSIGWHFECSDWSGQRGCACRCHEIAEKAVAEAQRSEELQ